MRLPGPLDALRPEEQSSLAVLLKPVRFVAGERLFRAGDAGDGCYVIQSGDIRIELDTEKEVDTEPVVGYVSAGSLLGELALLDGLPRSASAYADTDVSALYLSRTDLVELCDCQPHIGIKLLRALGRDASLKLRRNTERLADYLVRESSDPELNDMVVGATAAQRLYEQWPEERVDAMLIAVAEAVGDRAEDLAWATVEETKLGNVPDKTLKNNLASRGICRSLLGERGSGVLVSDADSGVTEIASSAGVVFGLIPITNPVATAIFKVLISLKSRCALILSFHHGCLGVGNAVCATIENVLFEHGAPAHLLQWVRQRSSRATTTKLMSHPGVSLILATGGDGMVKAAYSSGTPALGVGPGNAPTYIAADADIEAAARAIVLSKTFDNGLICAAEHNLVVDSAIFDAFSSALVMSGAAVLNSDEVTRFLATALAPNGRGFVPLITGQAAQAIADTIGICRDYPIKLLVVPAPLECIVHNSALAREKLAPVLSLFTVEGEENALATCRDILTAHGRGHTAIIHTRSNNLATKFGLQMPAGRILVNSPGVQGASGSTTRLVPSFTLGCGTFGGNSTTDNVTYTHLLNIKRLARFINP